MMSLIPQAGRLGRGGLFGGGHSYASVEYLTILVPVRPQEKEKKRKQEWNTTRRRINRNAGTFGSTGSLFFRNVLSKKFFFITNHSLRIMNHDVVSLSGRLQVLRRTEENRDQCNNVPSRGVPTRRMRIHSSHIGGCRP